MMDKVSALTWIVFLAMVPSLSLQQSSECTVSSTVVKVEENNEIGYVVVTISKADHITLELDTDFQFFKLSDDHSSIQLNESLDYEAMNNHILLIELRCLSSGLLKESHDIIVEIENVNDNPPEFSQTNYNFSVSENSTVDSSIAKCEAQDRDKDILFYWLNETDGQEAIFFRMAGPNSPNILLNKKLNYDRNQTMQLLIYARDEEEQGKNNHTASATITMNIGDSDDRPPWFQPCNPSEIQDIKICVSPHYIGAVNVSVKEDGPLILQPGPVYAIDGDLGINTKIVYTFIDGTSTGIFEIHHESGNITMTAGIDKEGPVTLTVMAYQENDPTKYATASVTINVVTKGTTPPSFPQPQYKGFVAANSEAGSIVLEGTSSSKPLIISVEDTKKNPNITYRIQGSSHFRITGDGFLLTTAPLGLDFEDKFQVIAENTYTFESDTADVIVTTSPVSPTTGPVVTHTVPTSKPDVTLTEVPSSRITITTTTTSVTTSMSDTGTTSKNPSVSSSTSLPAPGSATTTTTTTTTTTDRSTTTKMPAVSSSTPQPLPGHTTTMAPSGTETTTSRPSGSSSTSPPVVGATTSASSAVARTTANESPGFPSALPPMTEAPTTSRKTETTKSSTSSEDKTQEAATTHPTGQPGGSSSKYKYTAEDMAAVGVTLSILLLMSLILNGFLIYKTYGDKLKGFVLHSDHSWDNHSGSSLMKMGGLQFVNESYQDEDKKKIQELNKSDGYDDRQNMEHLKEETYTEIPSVTASAISLSAVLSPESLPGSDASSTTTGEENCTLTEVTEPESTVEKEVKSILTKERKSNDAGYKAVWFKNDIQPNATDDVLVIEGGTDEDGEEGDDDNNNGADDSNDRDENGQDTSENVQGSLTGQNNSISFGDANTEDINMQDVIFQNPNNMMSVIYDNVAPTATEGSMDSVDNHGNAWII